jgi:hypothetical protein
VGQPDHAPCSIVHYKFLNFFLNYHFTLF